MGIAQAPARPHEIVWNITNGVISSRSLHVVAELGVADLIDEEPVACAELAARCGVDASALDRVLRLLAAQGIFASRGSGYVHTEASRVLRSDHPMSMRAFARLMDLPVCRASYGALDHAVRTGQPAVHLLEPNGFFTYLQDHPKEAAVFGEAMTAKARADIAALLDAYDFRPFRTIADIGGGRGHLLRAVLDAAPGARGVLFDLPHVVDGLDTSPDRMTIVADDFFVDPLPAADAYLLMEVIHDWADAEATAILRTIRRAAAPGATVLIVEDVLPEDEVDARSHILDVVMLMVTGGRERSPSQFAELLRSADFRLTAVVDTAGPMRVIEGVAV